MKRRLQLYISETRDLLKQRVKYDRLWVLFSTLKSLCQTWRQRQNLSKSWRERKLYFTGIEQQFAFEELKRLITQAETLAYFKNFECFNCSVFIRLDTLWMKVHAENTDTPNKSLIIRSKNLVAKNLRAMRTCCIHGCQWQPSSCLMCEILL